MSRCQHERYVDLQSKHIDKFVINCESNGDYKPLQCWNSVGLCWCVRKDDGAEIFGSRTYFPNIPRCDVISESLKNICIKNINGVSIVSSVFNGRTLFNNKNVELKMKTTQHLLVTEQNY